MEKNSLQYLCIKQVCENQLNITNNNTNNNNSDNIIINNIPEDIKDKLLTHMLRTKTLNNENIKTFLSPTRHHLSLDCEGEGGWIKEDIFNNIALLCQELHTLSLANCSGLTSKELKEIVINCKDLNALSLRGCVKLGDEVLLIIIY